MMVLSGMLPFKLIDNTIKHEIFLDFGVVINDAHSFASNSRM